MVRVAQPLFHGVADGLKKIPRLRRQATAARAPGSPGRSSQHGENRRDRRHLARDEMVRKQLIDRNQIGTVGLQTEST